MQKKKVYKIRNRKTNKFVTAGYTSRSSWFVYPSAVIENNPHTFIPKEDFEIVVFKYVEDYTEPLK